MRAVRRKAKKYRRDKNLVGQDERYRIIYKGAKKILFLKHIKIDAEGFDRLPNKPVLFIPNHKSGIDPVILIKILYENKSLARFSLVGKIEIKKTTYLSAAFDLLDGVYLDRNDLRQQFEAFESQRQNFVDGRSLILFIEGHRYYGNDLGEFKSAALKIAYRVTAPIIPVVIYGSSGLFDSDKSNLDKKKHVYVSALDMIKPHDYITVKESFIAEQMKINMQNKYNQIMNAVKNKRPVFHEA
ncbi:hypothetical protein FACS1894166_06920 [Bacilli bacterium]|nr:hypothetical protein FACS1894166_06920 [Bacilli bacterium]